jgi:uncharacterized protein YkwD
MSHLRCLGAFLLSCCVLSVQADPPEREEFKMTAREKEVVDLTNLQRKKKGLPPLKPNPLLFKIARDHSANMAKQRQMKHILGDTAPDILAARTVGLLNSPFGSGSFMAAYALVSERTKTPFQRILAAGYDYRYAAENIAEADKDYTGKDIMKDWMDSEHHRKNIMYPKFTEIGVGIIPGKKNLLYYTQVFGTPLRPKK